MTMNYKCNKQQWKAAREAAWLSEVAVCDDIKWIKQKKKIAQEK